MRKENQTKEDGIMYEVRKITKGTYNDKKVKFFELWEKRNNTWFFCGHHIAPGHTANKRLIETVD